MKNNKNDIRIHLAMPGVIFLAAVCFTASIGGADEALTAGSDWTVSLEHTATPTIRYKHTPVISASYCFWAKDWRYVGAEFAVDAVQPPDRLFYGKVKELGLTFEGRVYPQGDNVLVVDYVLTAEKDLEDVVGGGLEFQLATESPAFAGPIASPTFYEDKSGWQWNVSGDGPVRVVFDKPLGALYFDRNDPSKIRAMFFWKHLAQGQYTIRMTIELPRGGHEQPAAWERYAPVKLEQWYINALPPDVVPLDLRWLNDGNRPAGIHGRVQAQGDKLVFADGTEARFWGANIAAYAVFANKKLIALHARRIAQLGYNLVRIHHHDFIATDSSTIIAKNGDNSRRLDENALDKLDWWIKCLKDEGVYVWLDLHVDRQFRRGDGIDVGWDEIERQKGEGKGFCYYNPRLQELMQEFNAAYLSHVNPYTKLAYKDDPAIVGLLLTNENDLVSHFGHLMLPDKNNPMHNRIFMDAVRRFAQQYDLPVNATGHTWVPGPSKLFLSNQEHLFNQTMIQHLRGLGVASLIATTNFWGQELGGLAPLSDGDIVDAHSYGGEDELDANPRYDANFLAWIATAQLPGKPLSITEWNVPYPATDRFVAPIHLAAVASLQGWDAPMIYTYSQDTLQPFRADTWCTYSDPALTGLMPAAAVAFRAGHIQSAINTYCIEPTARALFYADIRPNHSAAVRTLTEISRLTIGLPATPELPWLKPAPPAAGTQAVTDLNRDFIPPGQDVVVSDTGQIRRDWVRGIVAIDSPATQCVAGWIGGQTLRTQAAEFRIDTPKATIAFTSLDGQPLAKSERILLTAIARAQPAPGGKLPFFTEPVTGTIHLQSQVAGLTATSLPTTGRKGSSLALTSRANGYEIKLGADLLTHWFLLSKSGEIPTPVSTVR